MVFAAPVAVGPAAVVVAFEDIKLAIEPADLSSQYAATNLEYLRSEAYCPFLNRYKIRCEESVDLTAGSGCIR